MHYMQRCTIEGRPQKSKLLGKQNVQPAPVSLAVSLASSFLIASAVGMRTGILGDEEFWMRECNASSRSTVELLQSNNVAGSVAVSTARSLFPLPRHGPGV
jgi:hypothetical protein